MNHTEQPDWLKKMTSGIVNGHKVTVLIDGIFYAVLKNPGANWSDNGGVHYGPVSYELVKKTEHRNGVISGVELRNGGRVNKVILEEWRKLVQLRDDEIAKSAQILEQVQMDGAS